MLAAGGNRDDAATRQNQVLREAGQRVQLLRRREAVVRKVDGAQLLQHEHKLERQPRELHNKVRALACDAARRGVDKPVGELCVLDLAERRHGGRAEQHERARKRGVAGARQLRQRGGGAGRQVARHARDEVPVAGGRVERSHKGGASAVGHANGAQHHRAGGAVQPARVQALQADRQVFAPAPNERATVKTG